MKEVKMELLGFTKDTLDSYNKTIINSITEKTALQKTYPLKPEQNQIT